MKRLLILGGILVVLFGAALYINLGHKKPNNTLVQYLPYAGDKEVRGPGDTIYHSTGPFAFINQLGDTITEKTVEGKNYVVEYFFTTCQSICPIMNKNMGKVAEKIKGDAGFKILSHSVKPEEDSVPALLAYAKSHNADNNQWYFLTGDKKELYDMARYSYLLNNDTTIKHDIKDDFIHTQYFALVDVHGHIRGFYDGTADVEVTKLLNDIDLLRKEQEENAILLQRKK